MTTVVALIAIFVLCIGLAMLVANPSRLTNRIFAFGAVILATELLIINRSIEEGFQFTTNGEGNPLIWVRLSAAIKSFFPFILWLLGDSIANPKNNPIRRLRNSIPWATIGTFISITTLTEWYIPSESLPNNITKGFGYITINTITTISWILLLIHFIKLLQKATGIQKIEIKFIAVNLTAGALLATTLFSIGHIIEIKECKHAALVTIATAFTITGLGTTYYRVFEIKETAIIFTQKIIPITGLYILLVLFFILLESKSQAPLSLLPIALIAGILTIWIDRKTHELLIHYRGKSHAQMRYSIINIAKKEPKSERLIFIFEDSLKLQYRSKNARILTRAENALTPPESMFGKATAGWRTLCEIGWATPESLSRRRTSPGIRELQANMEIHDLGLVIPVPQESPEPSLLLALGTKESGAPYTYPEIKRIQEVAELMDNLLVRSQLGAQMELQARLESLAVMSRGLAHDLKNLITPVATFLNGLESKQRQLAEEDNLYAAARRSMCVISDYVEETHFFSKQMVPRIEPVNPGELLRDVALALRPKAEHASVTLEVGLSTEEVIRADRVLLLRLISNLVDNAIDASPPGCGVSLQARWGHDGNIKFAVIDSGAGISADILPRIFEPYFTTKDRGTSLRGFGLGLAICQKIVEIHDGRISVRSAPGAGTTFEVSIPKDRSAPHKSTSTTTAVATRSPLVPASA